MSVVIDFRAVEYDGPIVRSGLLFEEALAGARKDPSLVFSHIEWASAKMFRAWSIYGRLELFSHMVERREGRFWSVKKFIGGFYADIPMRSFLERAWVLLRVVNL